MRPSSVEINLSEENCLCSDVLSEDVDVNIREVVSRPLQADVSRRAGVFGRARENNRIVAERRKSCTKNDLAFAVEGKKLGKFVRFYVLIMVIIISAVTVV